MSEAAAKDERHTRLFRGRLCKVIKSVRRVDTGAIYDLVEYERQVTNRRTGSVSTEKLTRKLRRPGTGVGPLAREVEVEVETELGQ